MVIKYLKTALYIQGIYFHSLGFFTNFSSVFWKKF